MEKKEPNTTKTAQEMIDEARAQLQKEKEKVQKNIETIKKERPTP